MKIKFLKAFNGDSIWISFNEDKNIFNILIDGGHGDTYESRSGRKGELYDIVKYIRDNGQQIDLLVLTHFDDDHIGGILKWFSKDRDAYKLIKKVWFNSGKLIAKELNVEENRDLDIEIKEVDVNFHTSLRQGIKFEKYLSDNKLWDGELIKQGDVIHFHGIKFSILSPSIENLKCLLRLYKKDEDYFTGASLFDFPKPLTDFIDEESCSKFKFEEDNRVSNGSSIAFILETKDKKFLYLADAHPSTVIDGLNKFGYDKINPLVTELMKVSHHGSMYNTNKDLLEIVKTENYLISSNATRHGLPNKRTIARIIKNNPEAIINFNYDLKDKIFIEQDWSDFPEFKSKMQNEF